jgi:hypothetical protein
VNALDLHPCAKIAADGRGAEQSEDEKVRLCHILLSTFKQQYSDWKRISFLDRPMMRQEFTKLTEMSIEDMIDTLTKLEESLTNQAPVTEFVEPLRKLARFYRSSSNGDKTPSSSFSISRSRPSDPEILASMIADDAEKTLLDRLNRNLSTQSRSPPARTPLESSSNTTLLM